MKQIFIFDESGEIFDVEIVSDSYKLKENEMDAKDVPNGLYKPVLESGSVVEGLTQSEIDDIRNQPQPKSEVRQLKEQQANLVYDLMQNGVI